jgi:hypothetical protein
MVRALVIAMLALAPAACTNGSKSGGTGAGSGTKTQIAAPCGALADKVRDLYRSEKTGKPELDADLLEANVRMVLTDCSSDPARFTPCIQRADSVSSLERDCLIPLDDEGAVEGRRFNN